MQPGSRLGPYEIVAPIGAGGMGEVWRARDTRLDRDVAIKVLPAELASNPERLRRFEREARATASLAHPNVIAVFDVGVHDGAPYLVEELLAGESLRLRLIDGPLPVREALEIAVQIARGLSAAHTKGIVHRDLKPENVILTPDGTVKLLDFGLAKLAQATSSGDAETITQPPPTGTAPGRVLGSVAYMAPEQARGLAVDHRADIFALGVVLHELLAGERPFRGQSTSDTVAAILTREPPPLPAQVPAAVQAAVRRCLEKRPEDRFSSARDLEYALRAVVESAPREPIPQREEARPYPGLAAFSEADAKRFFGRDEEIAALWGKIPSRRVLAVIGPSGAGKSSFVRAGIVARAPAGWRCLVATPGQAPFAGLARALVPAFVGDPEAIPQLVDLHDPEIALHLIGRWRQRGDRGLVVVDQLEELFTLNPPEVQQRFAELLGKIAELEGVHVLLSLRDDFLFSCHAHPALAEIFESVTPLGPPSSEGLRRALVEPAKAFGFAYEDEALVGEMVATVEGERSALPLLAFAAASLWERRDQERKLLTRSSYEAIGGVAGALAQHAEVTLERIGTEKLPLVRGLFRNLVTAQETRCVLEVGELLSVFPDDRREAAHQVLRQLVDARLLTSFEVGAPDGSSHHSIQVVHESLLHGWPRLVRWRTEDEGSAQLRDQLRQASHLWAEKGRHEDLLWTGTSYREYQVWRERYPGGLSELEEAFAAAMSALAGRRRRRRRLVYAAVLAALVLVAGGLGVLLRRSVRETRRAEAESRQREAAQLLALGRLRLADHPNGALAYAIASLERSDNDAARRFAVEALWQGPPALFVTDPVVPISVQWSPDNWWIAFGGNQGLVLYERRTGARRQLSSSYESLQDTGFTPDGRRLVSRSSTGEPVVLHVWALPEGRLERTLSAPGSLAALVNDRVVTFAPGARSPQGELPVIVRRVSLDGSIQETLGEWRAQGLHGNWDVDPSGTSIFSMQEDRVVQQRLDALSAPPRVLGSQERDASVWMQPWRDRVVSGDVAGGVRIWDVASGRLERTLKSPSDARQVALDPKLRFLASGPPGVGPKRSAFLFDLAAPRNAEPLPLPGSEALCYNGMKFGPDGAWLGIVHIGTAVLWNISGARSTVLGRQESPTVTFAPDGHLVSTSDGGTVMRWPLSPAAGEDVKVLWSRPGVLIGWFLGIDPGGRFAVVAVRMAGEVLVVPLDGSKPTVHQLQHRPGMPVTGSFGSLDPSGAFWATTVVSSGHPELTSIRILDLRSGEERTLDTHSKGDARCEEIGSRSEGAAVPAWLTDGRLVTDGDAGLQVWDLATGASRVLRPCRKSPPDGFFLLATRDSRAVLRLDPADFTGAVSLLTVFDLALSATREITSRGNRIESFALDPTSTILVTGDRDGVVRVGPLTGEEPHLLFGHTGPVMSVAVSPDGRTIASGSDDGTIRLWPMPDVTKPPLHTLPDDELLAKLKSLTNLRAVRDPSSDTGWKIEIGPFPGWAVVPDWQP
jgi:eukaryotic-like serine/threonine-protein kinase